MQAIFWSFFRVRAPASWYRIVCSHIHTLTSETGPSIVGGGYTMPPPCPRPPPTAATCFAPRSPCYPAPLSIGTRLPRAQAADTQPDRFDAVIVGSGLGGLSCAAAFARQGFKALVLEQHDKPGGYAAAFSRPGGFVFDVSLHFTTVGERHGVHNLIPGFPEIQHLYRAIFPDYDLRVEQKNLPAYIQPLGRHFPEEKAGIQALFDDMSGRAADVMKFSQAGGKPDMRRFPADFPRVRQLQQDLGAGLDDGCAHQRFQAAGHRFRSLGVLRADALEAGQHLLRASDNPLHEPKNGS